MKKINEKFLAEFFGLGDSKEELGELAGIKEKLERIVYENNCDICAIDDDADGVYFIESGTAVVLGRDGSQINVLHSGQAFGEYAVLSGGKRLSTVRSHGRTVIYRMDGDDLLGFLRRHPNVYGEFMKRVYSQVSAKHSQILALSGKRRGVLKHPSNALPMSKRQVVIHYSLLLIIYLIAYLAVPAETAANWPVFLLPMALMLAYVLITKRTIESLLVSGILASILVYRAGLFAGFTDAVLDTMADMDNVFTVLVMALMGGMINLIFTSGGATAFEKMAEKTEKSPKSTLLTSLGIMAVTSIDDGLNMMCASYASHIPAKKNGIVREKLALFYSMLPTVLSSFLPLSLWGIFVIGTISATEKKAATLLFCRSIPFNFFSIITLLAMVALAFGLLPRNKQLKAAEKRYKDTGALWPEGSEKYLNYHDSEVWGRISNVMLPILVLAVASFAVRSALTKSFVVDSAVGLMIALAFMFLLYTFRGVMSQEQFVERLVDGMADATLPIVLYLLTTCFSTLLDALGLPLFFENLIDIFEKTKFLLPATSFVLSVLLTVVLGSSWSMYAITFPIVLKLVATLGLDPALFVGIIAGAGIAGEKICAFTAEATDVGTAVGINPDAAARIRISYALALSLITTVVYLIAGFFL
ncbi:MAG: cyclic nucleotide-binding domain-containing protein [Lachnospiraceae bacterium]|nr:cyclic nucleotide-binding domain-containing protein [Lachnospiraceae bacterium]